MSGFIFNFQKRFAPKVKSGEKLQTIRQNRKDGRKPAPGDTLHLWTGLRNTEAKLLGRRRCFECFSVYIDLGRGPPILVVNGIRLNVGEADSFAELDGFDNALQMRNWFRETYNPEKSFNGFCVKWSSRPVRKDGRWI